MKMELALYQALTAINVPELKAHAVIEAMESDMRTLLATKSDISALEHRLTAEIAQVRSEIAHLDVKLTIRMGVMLSATIGILITAMKFIF
ncbi:hypothetical protein [Pseudomonas brassicacearum]|uniref:DUF1640 domain-containing protein n=1 Tax=Pseudomonas brassicacearum (strain NFM421) TaxID=994484 RepID=F2KEZ0_PSEBN|nr:hypothetical protein [Pseudomonas brassicacearum]AEA68216.1 conserved hypothetical protein [Pseudomonas brassicacearum subsp. brassicacearum NFM421]QEO78822.1 hypothetical protein ELZ14_15100 [Pseudomonas brassicacearum]